MLRKKAVKVQEKDIKFIVNEFEINELKAKAVVQHFETLEKAVHHLINTQSNIYKRTYAPNIQ